MKTLFILSFITLLSFNTALAKEKEILGWIEYVVVQPGGLKLKAKLDTGAKTSSLRAKTLRTYQKGGEVWISYEISSRNAEAVVLDSKVERWVKIRKKDKKTGFLRRPVVTLGFCIKDSSIVGEVNLSPRSGFSYPVLVGRNMLKKHILVDTHKMFTTKPTCLYPEPIK